MKVIFWTNTIDDLFRKVGNIGGIAIQMSFWANVFLEKGWSVYSLTFNKKRKERGIDFIHIPQMRFLNIFIEFLFSFYYLFCLKPDLIILRGADRRLFGLSLFAKLFKCKLVFFGACDKNFYGKGNYVEFKRDVLFRMGLRNTKYVVLQNDFQKKLLETYFGLKKSCVIPNIWLGESDSFKEKTIDFLWVANLASLKRPMWFLNLAKKMPNNRFMIIGGANDRELYERCYHEAKLLSNVDFMGKLPFDEVNKYFKLTKCLICTSEYEGFPNTFLQAWSNRIPIISTVDPSDLLKTKGLGIIIKAENELHQEAQRIINSTDLYNVLQKNIEKYFNDAHNSNNQYERLLNLLDF